MSASVRDRGGARWVDGLRWLLVLAFAAGTVYYIGRSLRWPLMCDSPIMHYVNFLMQHGKQPYQTITDNNMPGAYLSEGLAMRVFGAGDLGWRVYEYFLLLGMTACMMYLARRVDWVAGVFAGGFFLLQHGAEGPVAAVEREQVITLLFLLGYVALFGAVERRKAWWLVCFGLLSGFAVSIKPLSLLLSVATYALALVVLYRRRISLWPYLGWALLGFFVALLCSAAFLVYHHALGPFWFVLHTITPAYVALAHPSKADMLRQLLPKDVRWFVLFLGVPSLLLGPRWTWERWALLLGVLAGLTTFFAQQKGFNHHRYTFEILLLFLVGLAFMEGLRKGGWARAFGIAGVLVAELYFAPSYVRATQQVAGNSDLTRTLEGDLTRLGGQQLQGRVMCFDMVYGCLDALYHLGLVENTGFTGDLLLFFPEEGYASTYYRQMYVKEQSLDPADVLVVTNEWLQRPNTFKKVDTWAAFEARLDADYTLVITREFPNEAHRTPQPPRKPGDEEPRAYRIYLRKGTAIASSGAEALGVPR